MYNFRVQFKFPYYRRIHTTKPTGSLVLEDVGTLYPVNKQKIHEASCLYISSSSYLNSKDEAVEKARKICLSLHLASLKGSWGIIVPSNNIYETIGDNHNQEYEDGIGIYSETGISMSGISKQTVDIEVGVPSDIFAAQMKHIMGYDLDPEAISEVHATALEMLNAVAHNQNTPSSFITCIAAIELVCPLQNEDRKFIDQVDKVIGKVKQDKDIDEIDKLINKLRSIKEKGAKTSCTEMIEGHLGEEQAKTFKKLYRMRSDIAHGRYYLTSRQHHKSSREKPNLSEAYNLAKDLILAQLNLPGGP